MQRRYKIVRHAVCSLCDGILRAMEVPQGRLAVVFVTARRIRELNLRYRGRDYATDVLSFAYSGETVEGAPFLGEVVIAPEIASLQAQRWHVRPESEMRKLLAHGILHLLGYDHETDRGEMIRLQKSLLRRRSISQTGPLMAAGKGA